MSTRIVRSRRSGFTLIELLVVISIIALLISILLPSLGKARAQASKTQALAQIKGIQTSAHTYVADNSGWFPTNNPVGMPDNPSQLPTAGTNIYGLSVATYGNASTQPRDLQGLGALVDGPGESAIPETHMRFGSYLPLSFLFSPELYAFRRKHTNGTDGLQWFGHHNEPAGFTPDPGGIWAPPSYGGFFYMGSSYVYRHAFYADMTGVLGNNSQAVTYSGIVNGPHSAGLVGGVRVGTPMERNLKEDAPGLTDRAMIAETGGRHPLVGGGNYTLRDGSGHFFKNSYYNAGYYNKANSASEPLYLTCSGISVDTHHGIYPNLLMSAIDLSRDGGTPPGSE
jgi:prepilin-type N-terminal cleavage/methylation domain-containing protein